MADSDDQEDFSPSSSPAPQHQNKRLPQINNQFNPNKSGDFCCDTDRFINEQLKVATKSDSIRLLGGEKVLADHFIRIVNAEKIGEGGKPYIAYQIKIGNVFVKRRYSEFESLRKILKRLYPFIVVPVIPEKHSIGAYAKLQATPKEDDKIVELRRKMLEIFLMRVACHEILGSEHLFHRFLEAGSWSDVLFSQKFSKNEQSDGKSLLKSYKKLRNPDLKFLEAEQQNEKSLATVTALDSEQKKITKRISNIADVQGELGSVLNAFSLHEGNNARLSEILERVGIAMDFSAQASTALEKELVSDFGDFSQESVRLLSAAKNVLISRNNKHANFEELGEQLDNKRIQLSNMEKDSGTTSATNSNATQGISKSIFGSIGEKLHQMMDSDPEATRRSQIAKLKDAIIMLEKEREDAHGELNRYSEHLHADLKRFDERLTKDWNDLLLALALIMRKWMSNSLEKWSEAQRVLMESVEK